MKLRCSRLFIPLAIIIAIVSCVPKQLPPELKPLYTANEVLIRVHELQKLTIGLHDAQPSQISKERANLIVQFTVSAAEVVKGSLSGWQQTLKTMWNQLKASIKAPENGLLSVWILTDAVIEAL